MGSDLWKLPGLGYHPTHPQAQAADRQWPIVQKTSSAVQGRRQTSPKGSGCKGHILAGLFLLSCSVFLTPFSPESSPWNPQHPRTLGPQSSDQGGNVTCIPRVGLFAPGSQTPLTVVQFPAWSCSWCRQRFAGSWPGGWASDLDSGELSWYFTASLHTYRYSTTLRVCVSLCVQDFSTCKIDHLFCIAFFN